MEAYMSRDKREERVWETKTETRENQVGEKFKGLEYTRIQRHRTEDKKHKIVKVPYELMIGTVQVVYMCMYRTKAAL